MYFHHMQAPTLVRFCDTGGVVKLHISGAFSGAMVRAASAPGGPW